MEQALKRLMRIWLLVGANQYPRKTYKKGIDKESGKGYNDYSK